MSRIPSLGIIEDELEEEGIEVRVIGDAQNVKPGLKNIEEGYFAGLSI